MRIKHVPADDEAPARLHMVNHARRAIETGVYEHDSVMDVTVDRVYDVLDSLQDGECRHVKNAASRSTQ